MTIAYSPDALVYDAGTNMWSLRADFDITQHRVDIQFSDDDGFLDGDAITDETGDDSNQTAVITDMQGNTITSGQVYDEAYFKLALPGGGFVYIDAIEIDGVLVGYTTTAPLELGVDYEQTFTGNVAVVDEYGADSRFAYSQLTDVPCFGPGTHLMTTDGEVPVEWLATGDRLITRDHGAQKVVWVGRYKVNAAEMADNPSTIPCTIAAGTFSVDCPSHNTLLSPQHRILISGARVELFSGETEAFTAAKHLIDGDLVTTHGEPFDITYTHVLLAKHEVIMANGMWVESLFLGQQFADGTMNGIPSRFWQYDKLLAGHNRTARVCLKEWEMAAILGKHRSSNLPALIQRVA